MRLWKRASGVLKDRNSLWKANLSRRTALRNPEIEKAVIRATTHHELSFDTRNAERVCDWLLLSPSNLKPILWSISSRVEKTRSWVVALKALYLMHSLTNTRIPCVKKIGRLPFDLSAFTDDHACPAKSWPFNSFVRAYYAFLDNKSTVIFQHAAEEKPIAVEMCEEKAIVVNNKGDGLRTIITDKWERFEEDFASRNLYTGPPVTGKIQEPPDLITF